MCEKPETVTFLNCQDVVLLWLWPVLSLIGLVTNYYFNDFIQFELFKILSLMFKHSSCSLYGLLKFSCYKKRISSASLPPSSPPPAPEKKNIENNVGEIFSKLKSIQSDLSESLHNESDHGVIRYSLPFLDNIINLYVGPTTNTHKYVCKCITSDHLKTNKY